MNVYVLRFHCPERGSAFIEIVAATEADAREDFEYNHPEKSIISVHIKPFNHRLRVD